MKRIAVCALFFLVAMPVLDADTRQATGVKVGEVTSTSAIVWVRLTAGPHRNNDGIVPGSERWDGMLAELAESPNAPPADLWVRSRAGGKVPPLPEELIGRLEGACSGAEGLVRVRYGTDPGLADARQTDWIPVSADTDYTHQFHLRDLRPDTEYHYETQTAVPGGRPAHGGLRGRFRTAPRPHEDAEVTFVVITGQMYSDQDLPFGQGFRAYSAMAELDPAFIVPTGDTVYYDNDRGWGGMMACSAATARYKWHRMYSMPGLLQFHLRVPGYWEKDDHDALKNDCWPGQSFGALTWEQGLAVFREQVPMSERTYRTFRWGSGLQIWLVEGRDFRSPNRMPDGPDKTIWGERQKSWLKRSILASDADWRVLVSPTPIVGPDRPGKKDNHSNSNFQHEGDEFRAWCRDNVPDNFFVVCGDRHWQYHSVDPETGLNEFSCGPISDSHAGGWNQGNFVEDYHRFLRVKGGFLSVTVAPLPGSSTIRFRHRDVEGCIVNEVTWTEED